MISENTKAVSPAAHFLRRRDTWIRWVVESKLTPSARLVGVHLAMRMSVKTRGCWPNITTIGKSLQMSSRQAQRGMRELEKYGALDVTRHVGKGNFYTLRLPTDP